jgi:ubiquinol-cytochrome c reductase cytochrome c1 subunit
MLKGSYSRAAGPSGGRFGGARRCAMALGAALGLALAFGGAAVATEHHELKDVSFSFEGPFGRFDRAALQRGFQVYNEVCSACHSMNFMHYRNLAEEGGPEFSEAAVKAIAASKQVHDGPNAQGDMFDRPGRPSDAFVSPYPNEDAARAANAGAAPPDLSLIVKAREGGARYVYSILTGFQDPPPGVKVREGLHYNPYFPGEQIAMPPPLSDGLVQYTDGTKATVDQMAHDVATFLTWASEPKMEARKRTGFDVLIYLIIFAGLTYFAYRKVWAEHH